MIIMYGNGVGSRLKTAASSIATLDMNRNDLALTCGSACTRFGEPDLVEHLERRGMNRVAAKVAIEIPVRLEQRHAHARAREQQRQHDAGGSGADDATARALGPSVTSSLGSEEEASLASRALDR